VKIIIAPDSFKESLSAAEAARAIAAGVCEACPQARIRCIPMADGGEGTVAAVLAATRGEWRYTNVHGALDDLEAPAGLGADWGWLQGDGTEPAAVIEMAAAAGLEQTPPESRDPLRASSYGVGELMRAALDAGARRIILGLGGSSCNDGGAGMLCALGVRLFDAAGRDLPPGGAALANLDRIDASNLDARLREVVIEVASDVDNPLTGPNGATYIFGPQKGATPAQLVALDAALAHFGELTTRMLGRDLRDAPGAGAAGGLGYAALAYLGARFRPGVAVVAELGGLADAMAGAVLAFTGEGRLDAQTLRGKTPAGVARIAQAAGVPLVALAGSLGEGYEQLYDYGLTAAFSLVDGPMALLQAKTQAARLLTERTRDVMRVWLAGRSESSASL